MSRTVLNKIAQRPPRIIATKAVVLYKCHEGGLDHQKWVDVDVVLKEGDKLVVEFSFEDFNQYE